MNRWRQRETVFERENVPYAVLQKERENCAVTKQQKGVKVRYSVNLKIQNRLRVSKTTESNFSF